RLRGVKTRHSLISISVPIRRRREIGFILGPKLLMRTLRRKRLKYLLKVLLRMIICLLMVLNTHNICHLIWIFGMTP
ncbi:hypothetical protein ACH5RR_026617, partial [Cinchona calisaya]